MHLWIPEVQVKVRGERSNSTLLACNDSLKFKKWMSNIKDPLRLKCSSQCVSGQTEGSIWGETSRRCPVCPCCSETCPHSHHPHTRSRRRHGLHPPGLCGTLSGLTWLLVSPFHLQVFERSVQNKGVPSCVGECRYIFNALSVLVCLLLSHRAWQRSWPLTPSSSVTCCNLLSRTTWHPCRGSL